MGNCCGKVEIHEKEKVRKHLELMLKIQLNEEEDEIYKVYELSDKRLAVELENCIKIYSLETFQLMTEINHKKINKSIELKNKDIAITDYDTVYFYKLSGNNYSNYLKLKEKYKNIFAIYELKNENLILSISHCLMLYSKGKENYIFLSKFELTETVVKILEIKNNVLFLFLVSKSGTFATADYSPYLLELLDTEKKVSVHLDGGSYSYYNDDSNIVGCNLLIKNNKYLYVRYAGKFCIYDIQKENPKEMKIIYKINNRINVDDFPLDFECLCDYDHESFIIIPSGEIYKYDESANKIIKKEKFNIEIENLIDIIKLKNNNFVAHNKHEIFIINKN